MLSETDHQVSDITGGKAATHVIAPCGAGSIAQAVTQHFKSSGRNTGPGTARVITVEASGATCLKASLEAGEARAVETGDTIMCGMNCGTLSTLAWPILRDGVDASVVVTDQESHMAVGYCKARGIMAGPCGAATLAALKRACAEARDGLGFGPESVVVLCCTEGSRDYDIPT